MATNEEKAAAAAKKAEDAAAKKAAAAAKKAAESAPASGETETIGDIEVGDPQLLRPVELPLVVKPADGGKWANDAQAEYAKYLNAYAYRNPKKWGKKKGDVTAPGGKVIPGLISKLAKLATNPELLTVYKGEPEVQDGGKVTYSDKRISQ